MSERNNEYVYQPPAKFTEELRQKINNAGFSNEFKQQIKSAQKEEGRKMFERLTERTSDGIAYTKIPLNESHLNKRGVIEQCFTGFVADRLAAYEDIGLSPEEITAALSRLEEYEALRPDVLRFAKAMEAVLKKHDDRPGWEREPYSYLTSRLETEFYEFLSAYLEGNVRGMKHEAVDVANFCMMLFCNIERDEATAMKGEGE